MAKMLSKVHYVVNVDTVEKKSASVQKLVRALGRMKPVFTTAPHVLSIKIGACTIIGPGPSSSLLVLMALLPRPPTGLVSSPREWISG